MKLPYVIGGSILIVGGAVAAWQLHLARCAAVAEEKLPVIECAIAKVTADQALMSDRIREIGRRIEQQHKTKVDETEALLVDKDLNRLALLYLGSDWALPRSEFAGSVRHMKKLHNMQQAARKEYRAKIDKQIKRLEEEKRRIEQGLYTMRGPRSHSPYDKVIKRSGRLYNPRWHNYYRHHTGLYSSKEVVYSNHESESEKIGERNVNEITKELAILKSTDKYQMELGDDELKRTSENEIFKLAGEYRESTITLLDEVMGEWKKLLAYEYDRALNARNRWVRLGIWPFKAMAKRTMGE